MKRECMLAVLLCACACAEATPEPTGAGEDATAAVPGSGAPSTPDAVVDPVPAAQGGIDREPLRDAAPVAPVTPVVLPHELECVSAIEVAEGHEVSSWRATLVLDGDASRITLVESPRFQSHAGVWSSEPEPALREAALHATGPLTFAGEAGQGVSLALAANAPFFDAELELDGTTTELSCWDRIAIFGSSWSSQPVALARFDARGSCVDADGAPAPLNELPLEFVLASSHGECADLRGALLNAGDYANPDIFLNLRGADLTDASLQHASLSGSLEGTRLAELDYGYASVSGSIDDATELPALGECVETESAWAGRSVKCQR